MQLQRNKKKDVVRQKDVHVAVPDLNVLAVVEIAKVIIVTTAQNSIMMMMMMMMVVVMSMMTINCRTIILTNLLLLLNILGSEIRFEYLVYNGLLFSI